MTRCRHCGAPLDEPPEPPSYAELTALIDGAPVDLDPEHTPPAGAGYPETIDRSAEDPA